MVTWGFNPSSIGNRPQSIDIRAGKRKPSRFNPSSIGNRPQRQNIFGETLLYGMFQSFFYWKSASKWLELRVIDEYACFNPSSIGNRPQSPTFRGVELNVSGVSILLLLEIGLKDINPADGGATIP